MKRRRLSLKKTILLLFCCLIIIPSLAVGFYMYNSTYRAIKEDMSQSILQAVRQIENNLALKMDGMGNVSNTICYNETVQSILRYDEDEELKKGMEDGKYLENILRESRDNNDVLEAKLFVDPRKIYANQNVYTYNKDDAPNYEWYGGAVEENGRLYWYGTPYDQQGGGGYNVVTCVRVMKDLQMRYDDLGFLALDISSANFFDSIAGVDSSWGQSVFAVDGQNNIIYGDNADTVAEHGDYIKTLEFAENESEGVQFDRERNAYVIYAAVRDTDWKILAYVPMRHFSAQGNILFDMFLFNMIAFLMVLLFVTVVVGVIVNLTVKKVRGVIQVIETEGIEGIEHIPAQQKGDELQQLESEIKLLASKIKTSMDDVYEAQVNERDARLKALQAQINPHFLYNTLDTINWMAIKHDAPDISFMLDTLARYFRLSLSKGKDIVLINDEIELTRTYFAIQEKRFINTFTVTYDVAAGLYHYLIPKLTIQPLVENALLHGYSKKLDRPFEIQIQGFLDGDDIVISVTDNGVGMCADQLTQIQDSANADSEKHLKSGYGIYNAHNRIKIYCGDTDRYGIHLTSELDVGTKAVIRVKAVRAPEPESENREGDE